MTTAAELEILLTGKDQSASSTIDDVEKKTSGLGKTMQSVGTIAGGFLAAGVVQAGVSAVTGFIGDSINAIKESMQVNAQLEAVLQSTGNAAGVTAEHVTKLAGSIEKNSLFEDEAILKGQNLLLTFTNIRNDTEKGIETFDDATKIMVDMAAAMGTDASGAAIQLGKALNDPEKGITALTRVGVTFTEEQKEQIATMQEAGDIAGAQAVILQELTKEFGGSAKAQSDAAGASERYKDRMNDLQETIGEKMLPVNEKLMEAKIALIDLLVTKVIPVIEDLYTKYWPGLSKAIGDVVAFIQTNWPLIQPIIEFAANFVKTQIEGMIQVIQGIVEVVTGVIALVDDLVHGRWAQAWSDLQQIAEGVVDIFIGNLKRMFGSIPQLILDLAGEAYSAGLGLANSIVNGVKNGLENFSIKVGFDTGIPGVPSVSTTIRPFSFLAEGIAWVPYDYYPAMLHRGERVLTADENRLGAAAAGGGDVNVYMSGPVYASTRDEAERSGRDLGWAIGLARHGATI